MPSPLDGAVDVQRKIRIDGEMFLKELGQDGWSERLMAGVWLCAGSVTVRRQEPVATKAGKILPFHVSQH